MGNGLELAWAMGWSWQHVRTLGKGSVENIAYRMSASWHMRILVPSRSLQGDGNLYHK